jgi:hypothetical protein
MFLARRRYLSTTLSAEEANQFDRDNCDAYDFSSEQSRWYLTELSHVRFLYWKVSGWLRLKNNLVRSVRHAGVQVLVLLESGGHPGSGMELYTFFKARPERTTIYNMSSVDSAGVLFFLGPSTLRRMPAVTASSKRSPSP